MLAFDWKEKTALITGASRGIGLEIAKQFCGNGAKVAFVASKKENAEHALKNIPSYEGLARPYGCNMRNKEGLAVLCQEVEKDLGKIDFFVHSAGVTQDNLLVRMTDEEWENVLQTNLSSTFYLARSLAKSMMKQRFGRIVLISSIVGFTGNPGQVNYATTKAGLVGFCKSLSQELASRNVLINLVAPGFIATDMTNKLNEEQKQSLLEKIPMKRMGSATEVAAGVMFLCSPHANYITGTTLHINGGMY